MSAAAPDLPISLPAGGDRRRLRWSLPGRGLAWLLRRLRAWWIARNLDDDTDLRQGGHE